MFDKKEMLKEDFGVGLQIFETTVVENEFMTYPKLVRTLDGRISKKEISPSLDRLFDMGIIDIKFEHINDEWTNVIYATEHGRMFLKAVYDECVENN